MKKVIVSVMMSFALLASTGVMAQDTTAKSPKAKTECKEKSSCCSDKKKDKKECKAKKEEAKKSTDKAGKDEKK